MTAPTEAQPAPRDVVELHGRRCVLCEGGLIIVRWLAGQALVSCTGCAASGDRIRRKYGIAP